MQIGHTQLISGLDPFQMITEYMMNMLHILNDFSDLETLINPRILI